MRSTNKRHPETSTPNDRVYLMLWVALNGEFSQQPIQPVTSINIYKQMEGMHGKSSKE